MSKFFGNVPFVTHWKCSLFFFVLVLDAVFLVGLAPAEGTIDASLAGPVSETIETSQENVTCITATA